MKSIFFQLLCFIAYVNSESTAAISDENGQFRELKHMKKSKSSSSYHHQEQIMVQPHYQPVIIRPALPIITQRVEVSQVLREKSCPVGMELMGEQCVGTEITQPCNICPPSTVLQNGFCVSSTSARISCPEGFRMLNGKCMTCDMMPATFTCRDPNAILEGMGCSISVEQPPICPPGFQMTQNGCTQNVANQIQCPQGYDLTANSKCVRSEKIPASVICPDGATFNSETQKCSVIQQNPPRCPHRFNFDSTMQSCQRFVPQILAPCPAGFIRVGSMCQRSDISEAELYCQNDSIFENGSCIKEIPIAPQCPSGYQNNNNGSCEKIVKEIPICPHGTQTLGVGNNLICQIIEENDIIQCCAPGFNLVGNSCTRIESFAPELSCENECFIVHTSKMAFACPPDSEFVDHPTSPKCVNRIIESICDHPVREYVPPRRCAQEMKLTSEEKDSMRALHGKEYFDDCTPPTMKPVASCRDVSRDQTTIAQPYCPDGGVIEDNHCVSKEPIVPERKCRVGFSLDLVSGQCSRQITVPVKSECPAGTTRQGLKCLSYQKHQPTFICPDGSSEGPNGCCIVSTTPILPPPKVIKNQPLSRCLVGQMSGNRQCVDTQKIPTEMICPNDSQMIENGKCVIQTDLIIPQPIEKNVKPSYVCPDGTRAHGQLCYMVETIMADSVCPFDTQVDGNGKCFRQTEALVRPPRIISSIAVPICPPGTQTKGTTCVSNREVEPISSCPAGYEFGQNMMRCISSTPPQSICPKGTAYSMEGCIRHTYSAPQIRIVKGCVNEVLPMTCNECPRQFTSQCH